MSIHVKFLDVNTPTINGRVYTKECLQKALDNLPANAELPVVFSNDIIDDSSFDVTKVVGVATDIEVDDTELCASIEILDTPMGKILKNLDIDSISYTPIGTGNLAVSDVDNTQVVQNYTLSAIGVITDNK